MLLCELYLDRSNSAIEFSLDFLAAKFHGLILGVPWESDGEELLMRYLHFSDCILTTVHQAGSEYVVFDLSSSIVHRPSSNVLVPCTDACSWKWANSKMNPGE